MSDTDDSKKREMEELFLLFLQKYHNQIEREEALYNLSECRAEWAIDYAIIGLGIDREKALELVRVPDDDTLTQRDADVRDRLIAAIDNLIDFAVCAEYQLYKDVERLNPNLEIETFDDEDDDDVEPYLNLNRKYNDLYADVENGDIQYALAIAVKWITWQDDTMITYLTQNDDRVRPWHFILHGFSARRSEFPNWMIPPIEWACRCYIVSDGEVIANRSNSLNEIYGKKIPDKPEAINGIFKESVCTCGRIFSDEHPYFDVNKEDLNMINGFVERLRTKYYG